MSNYNKITALYSRLSVGDEDRDGGESNSIQNQKIFLENYAKGQHLTNIRHYIDDDESGRFFDRSAYSRMIEDVESGKIGVCIMKDLTRWGRDYLQVGNAMEIFRRNNVRFIAVNNGIDSENPDTLEFAPFINIMSEWYAKDISKKVKTGIKTKGMSGKPIATEAPYGYIKLQQEQYYRNHFGKDYIDNDYVFTWEDGHPYSPDYVSHTFHKLLKKYDLPHIRFHDLRHTCASMLLSEGYGLKDVQEWLGHSDIKMTANIYGHLDIRRKRSIANGLEQALPRLKP